MNMKKWLISGITLIVALGAAGAVTAFALAADGGGSDPEVPNGPASTGEVPLHGDPTYEQWLSDHGDGQVVTSIDDIDPNVCNTVHNINACTSEELEERGMAPVTQPIAVGEPYLEELSLENTQWKLKSYGDPDDARTVLKGSEITAVFDGREGSIRGSAGCNTYSGSYEAEDNTLAVGHLVFTEMGCSGPDTSNEDYGQQLMNQEQMYLSALGAAQGFEVADNQLQVRTSDGPILTFSRASGFKPGYIQTSEHECDLGQGVYVTSEGEEGCVDAVVVDDGGQDPIQAHPPVIPPRVRPSAG